MLGTLREVARRIGVTRGVARAAVDAGLLRPGRIRKSGSGSYTRLFDLDAAAAARSEILAALDARTLVPRSPRTHPRRAASRPPSAPSQAAGRQVLPGLDLTGSGLRLMSPEEEREFDRQTGGWNGRGR
jgi:hypothetical protein